MTALFLALKDRAPDDWTLRDVCLAVSSHELLIYLLEHSERDLAKTAITQFLGGEKKSDVYSQLLVDLAPLRSIASGWHGKKKISMRDWVRSETVLLLPNEESLREQLQKLTQVLLGRIVPLLETHDPDHVHDPGATPPLSWVFIDEFEDAGSLTALPPLIKKGRSFGVCTAIAFQSMTGLESSYTPSGSHSIIGSFGSAAILRLGCQKTAEWAADYIGKAEQYQYTKNKTYSKENSTSVNEQVVMKHVLTPDQIKQLDTVDASGRLNGVAVYRSAGVHLASVPMASVIESLPTPDSTLPLAQQEQLDISPFTEEDALRLQLPWPIPGSKQKPKPEVKSETREPEKPSTDLLPEDVTPPAKPPEEQEPIEKEVPAKAKRSAIPNISRKRKRR